MKSALGSDVDRLIAEQAASWPLLARGLKGLRQSQTRTERVAGRELLVRHIPHRIASTTAAVDAVSISRRPCFLCPANLPAEEKGLPFDSSFNIYCNPFPILERHLTIVHLEHRPQRIKGWFAEFLSLAEALPDLFVIYNGPACGASAPDHLHFQACSRDVFPIEKDAEPVHSRSIPDYARRVLIFRGTDHERLALKLEKMMQVLEQFMPGDPEPMVNIAGYYRQPEWTVLVFPRGRHRPRVFETGEFTVSPATIDLCGVFVVPVLKDFERIQGADIERIFEEVTLPRDRFDRVLKGLEEQ